MDFRFESLFPFPKATHFGYLFLTHTNLSKDVATLMMTLCSTFLSLSQGRGTGTLTLDPSASRVFLPGFLAGVYVNAA